jgi:hypothetical protein
MNTDVEPELSHIFDAHTRGTATTLDKLIQGYSLYARTEGKSPKTVAPTVSVT